MKTILTSTGSLLLFFLNLQCLAYERPLQFLSHRSDDILLSLNQEIPGHQKAAMSELEILLHMKEEEKLARDVYSKLHETWKVPVFANITRAESVHLNAIISLLRDYGDEYTGEGEPGKFSNPDFQQLYDRLTTEGSRSVGEAYKAGALIEEMDIRDITEYLAKVQSENIIMVFGNLRRGSRNHLRAFNRHITGMGMNYTPVHISLQEFGSIINSPQEPGGRLQSR